MIARRAGSRPARGGRPALRAAALVALVTAGCSRAESILWLGKTPDRAQRVVITDGPDRQQLFIGGRLRARFDRIAPSSLVWSADAQHFALAVRSDHGWAIVRDGVAGPPWDAVAELTFAAHAPRFAYAAERAGRWHVVVEQHVGPAFDAIMSGSLRASADGQVWAYVAEQSGRQRVVVGEALGPAFDAVGELSLSADGQHFAHTARRGRDAYFVLDGSAGPAHERASELTLTSSGQLAGIAQSGGRSYPVLRAQARDVERRLVSAARASGLVLSADARHVAWKVASAASVDVMRDEVVLRSHAALEPRPLAFRPGGALLAYVARERDGSRWVVLDDVPLGPWDEVSREGVVFSEDGRRAGFSARRGTEWHVLIDGETIAREVWASAPSFSADGSRQAHVARRDGRMVAVVDGSAFPFDLVVENSFGFSRDGQHWACVAGSLASRQLFFVSDGRAATALDFRELLSSDDTPSQSDLQDRIGRVLRRWTAAEAEAAASAAPRSTAAAGGTDG